MEKDLERQRNESGKRTCVRERERDRERERERQREKEREKTFRLIEKKYPFQSFQSLCR